MSDADADQPAGYPIDYVPGKARDKMYDGILAYVQASEEKIVRFMTRMPGDVGLGLKVPLTTGDISFLVEEVFGRSVVTGVPTKLVLIRWWKPTESTMVVIGEGTPDEQRSSNLRLSDLVCMTKEEATRHQKEVLQGDKSLEDLYDAEVIARVIARQKDAATYEKYR